MIRADQIPDEPLEAAVTAFKRAFMAGRKDAMEAAITACLEAWQGAVIRPPFLPNHIILPLPTENPHD